VSAAPGLDALREIPLDVSVVLGTKRMTVAELLALGEGSVVTLDRTVESPVDVLAGGALVARGEVVAVDDRFAVRITNAGAQ
jgi:flagellar motor switch protein FliN/FliY